MKSSKFFRFWFPVCVYSGIIFYASSIEQIDVPLGVDNIDKFIHIIEYMPFGFLVARAFANGSNAFGRKYFYYLTILCSVLYGLSDEFHQMFVVGRDANIIDAVADTIGGTIGGFVFPIYNNKVKTRKEKS